MHRTRILILEEDEEMRVLIKEQISSSDFLIDQASNFNESFKILSEGSIHLFLTDFTIPEISFDDLLYQVRNKFDSNKLAILVIAQELGEEERLKYQAQGVDDFLIKPFERTTLLHKIKTLIRKVKPSEGSLPLQSGKRVWGDITLDVKSFDVFCKEDRIHLTPNEFKLLQVLVEHAGEVLGREQLIELVQGEGIIVVDRAIDTHIFSLRKKLGTYGDQIETVRGSGYRIK